METNFDYCDKERAWFTSDEKRWINKIRKLAARFPDQVTILRQPEDNDGCIVARLPQTAIKINLICPRKYSDEELAIMTERLKSAQKLPRGVGKSEKPKKEAGDDDQNA